jgi:hypothetical protein
MTGVQFPAGAIFMSRHQNTGQRYNIKIVNESFENVANFKYLEMRATNQNRIFLFTTASRPALGSTQPPIQWLSGVLYPEVKRSGRETDYSPPSVLRLRMREVIPPLPQYVFMAWCLIKQ